jgi:hypothetical protein
MFQQPLVEDDAGIVDNDINGPLRVESSLED